MEERNQDERDELDENLPVKRPFGGDQQTPHVQAFLQVPESLLHDILHPVNMQGVERPHLLVRGQAEIPEVTPGGVHRLHLLFDGSSTLWRYLVIEKLFVIVLVFLDEISRFQFLEKPAHLVLEGRFLFQRLFHAEIVVEVDAPFFLDDVSPVGAFLLVVPFRGNRQAVGLDSPVVVQVVPDLVDILVKIVPYKFRIQFHADEELHVLAEEAVDVRRRTEAPVHDEL